MKLVRREAAYNDNKNVAPVISKIGIMEKTDESITYELEHIAKILKAYLKTLYDVEKLFG